MVSSPKNGAVGGDGGFGGYGRGLWFLFFCSCLFLYSLFVKGTHTPSFAHSAPLRVEDFFVTGGPGGPPFCFLCNTVYPLRDE
jgi:hypothetical protein